MGSWALGRAWGARSHKTQDTYCLYLTYQHFQRLLKAPSNLALNTSKDGASTTSLGNLFQCLTTLIGKNFFLISNLNLPSFSLKPLPLALSLHALVLEGCNKISLEPSHLQAEQPQLSQPAFIGGVCQTSDHLHGPPLFLLQQVHVILMVWLAFWAASSHCRIMLSFSSTNTPKSFSSGLLSIHSLPSLHLCLGLPRPMCRTLHLALLNFMRFAGAHLSKPVKVPLDGIPSFQHVDYTTELGVIGKLSEGALNPTVHVADKDVNIASPNTNP
ncbi:hypothetical protein QYF61_005739 [Mycteria americana]|uniref:Uncharacterized protein n=1 Tax=Mycteria americana TaxID=33587 RepID=A0AAN7PBW7_MYCAM|nr:hypothetical protein QYF61_005739 [Mycteria americana]